MPNLYIIAGCNGAGKTTASMTILPEILNCREFVNADMIAYGISPLNMESVAFQAGRLMLHRINELLESEEDFAFETTLATRSYVGTIEKAKQKGYKVTLLFFWLHSSEQAKERVAQRVANGGHHINDDVVDRRYKRGIRNFFELYCPICDDWLLVDNTTSNPTLIANSNLSSINVADELLWKKIHDLL